MGKKIGPNPTDRAKLGVKRSVLTLFNQVRLDRETDTIVWTNGADFDPATLHDWPTAPPSYTGSQSEPAMVRETKPGSS